MEAETKPQPPRESRILQYLFLAFLLSLILSVVFGLFLFLQLLVPTSVAILTMWSLFIFLLRYVSRSLIFPGANRWLRRSQEYAFMQNRAKVILQKLESIIEFIELIVNQNTVSIIDFDLAKIQLIYERITKMLITYEKIKETSSLSQYQENFQAKLVILKKAFDSTFLSLGGDNTFTFSKDVLIQDLMDSYLNFQVLDRDSKAKLRSMIEVLQKIGNISSLPSKQQWKEWHYNNTFCCIKFLKAELQTQYPMKLFTIATSSSAKIDCALVLAKSPSNSSDEEIGIDSRDPLEKEVYPTVIICNPNAGFLEFAHYQNEWLQFYHGKGVNVCLWNYRGYGNSTGTPSPANVFKDAELLVDYLRNTEQISRIGVHGQSLGGMVACHLAVAKNLDFLCADRTFSCVSDVAFYSMMRAFKPIVRIISNYDVWSAWNFAQARCYKILAFDPKDEVITYQASLKTGVTIAIAEQLLRARDQSYQIHNQPNSQSLLLNFKGFFNRTFCKDQVVKKANSIWLTEEDSLNLYTAFKRVIEIVKFVLEPQAQEGDDTQNGSPTNSLSSSNSQELQQTSDKKKKSSQQRGVPTGSIMKKQSVCDLNSTLDYSSILNGSIVIDFVGKDDDSKNASLLQIHNIHAQDNLSDHADNSAFPPNDSVIAAETDQSTGISAKLAEKKKLLVDPNTDSCSYLSLLDSSHKENEEFKKVIKALFTLFDSYDAGGLTLVDVFCLFKEQSSFDIFSLFIMNLNIWGSQLPLNQVIRKKIFGDMSKKYAGAKTKEIIKKLDNISKSNSSINGMPEAFTMKFCEDIGTIVAKLKILKEHLTNNIEYSSSTDQLLAEELPEKNKRASDQKNRLTAASAEKSQKGYENLEEETSVSIKLDDINKIRGNLLPLSCGHNGCYSVLEISVLEFHLKNSGFLTSNSNQ